MSTNIFAGVPPDQVDSALEALQKSAMNASIVPLDYSLNDDEYDRILKGTASFCMCAFTIAPKIFDER